jgi:hypothetical protein
MKQPPGRLVIAAGIPGRVQVIEKTADLIFQDMTPLVIY